MNTFFISQIPKNPLNDFRFAVISKRTKMELKEIFSTPKVMREIKNIMRSNGISNFNEQSYDVYSMADIYPNPTDLISRNYCIANNLTDVDKQWGFNLFIRNNDDFPYLHGVILENTAGEFELWMRNESRSTFTASFANDCNKVVFIYDKYRKIPDERIEYLEKLISVDLMCPLNLKSPVICSVNDDIKTLSSSLSSEIQKVYVFVDVKFSKIDDLLEDLYPGYPIPAYYIPLNNDKVYEIIKSKSVTTFWNMNYSSYPIDIN